MKFGKRIRTELSPRLLDKSLNYKALKQIAKELRRGSLAHQRHQQQQHQHQHQRGVEAFFARLEVEKEKVAEFYWARETWCFMALETTRAALFGLTRRASEERLCSASNSEGVVRGSALGHSGEGAAATHSAGELEGKFLEAKAGATVLMSETRDLVKFTDMNMHAFRKVLKKFDKWIGGVRGREYFTKMLQTQPWINGGRAHGVLRMASAMADHLRNLRPALSLGPAAGGPSWADRIVYSVGTFDRPRFFSSDMDAVNSIPEDAVAAAATSLDDSEGSGIGVAEEEEGDSSSPLRFLREFGAVVVVGVYTDAALASLRLRGGGSGGGGGRAPPMSESLEARCLRVRRHADHVVAVGSPDPARVREVLLGAAAGVAAAGKGVLCDGGDGRDLVEEAGGVGEGRGPTATVAAAPSKNCCFVECDWEAGGAAGRSRRDVQAVMGHYMPVFRLPSPLWDCGGYNGVGREEGVEMRAAVM